MKRFEIRKTTVETKNGKNAYDRFNNLTDQYTDLVAFFDTLEEAQEAYAKLAKPSVRYVKYCVGGAYEHECFYLAESEYYEDGEYCDEWVEGDWLRLDFPDKEEEEEEEEKEEEEVDREMIAKQREDERKERRERELAALDKFEQAESGCFDGFDFVEVFHEKYSKYDALFWDESDDCADCRGVHVGADGVSCYFFVQPEDAKKIVSFNRSVYIF